MAAGEEVVITRSGEPVAKLVPLPSRRRVLGLDALRFEVPADFDAPLPEEILDEFEQAWTVLCGFVCSGALFSMTTTITASLVFTDLVGSTQLASSMSHADAELVRRAHDALLREVVAATGGVEVKHTGDGLMLRYGSVGAALDGVVGMQQVIERHNRRSPTMLGVRIGLSTGDVTEDRGDFFGEAAVEAARLCAMAEGGQILATALVSMQSRRTDHRFEALGSFELKGLPTPVEVCEVVWSPAPEVAEVPLPYRLALTPVSGVVGRSLERERLETTLKETVSGDGRRIVFVSGEPGIGKTTLCCDLAQRAHGVGATVLYAHCDEHAGGPYQPFVEVLAEYLSNAPDGAIDVLDARQLSELSRLVPDVRGRIPDLMEPRDTDPDTERYLFFGAVRHLLIEAAARRPVVVVLDDLHWADTSTVLLLRHLAATLDTAAVLIVATYRDSDLAATHPLTDCLAAMWREPGVERFGLVGLDDAEVVSLLEAFAGHELQADGVHLAHAVRRDTDGNPFFTAEVLRHLAETGAISREDDRWVASVEVDSMGLPQSVRDVVSQRVLRLGEDAHRVLTAAAVIGQDFDVALLAQVTQTDEDGVLDALETAASAQIVREADREAERFRFSHALFQHALYHDLSASRRARMHHLIGEALEAELGDDPGERISELAHHWAAATKPSDTTKAIEYTRRAGDQALASLAPDEALRCYRTALELLEAIPDPSRQQRAPILVGLGTAQRQVGDPDFRDTLLRAAAEATRAGDMDQLVAAALENQVGGYVGVAAGTVDEERVAVVRAALDAVGENNERARASLLATLVAQLAFNRDLNSRIALAEEAEAIARQLNDPATLLGVLIREYPSLWVPQHAARHDRHAQEAYALAVQVDDPSAQFFAAQHRLYAAASRADRSGLDSAIEVVSRTAHETGQPFNLWTAKNHRCWLTLLAGDADAAECLATEALQLASEAALTDAMTGFGALLANIRLHQGRADEMLPSLAQVVAEKPGLPVFQAVHTMLLCECGELDRARSLVAEARDEDFHRSAVDYTWLTSQALWADSAAMVGDARAASTLFDSLAPYATQGVATTVSFAGTVDMYLARLAVTLERDDAVEYFERADAQLRALGAPFWQARNEIEWARHLAHQHSGQHDQARQLLTEAIATSHEYGCAGLTRRAEDLLNTVA